MGMLSTKLQTQGEHMSEEFETLVLENSFRQTQEVNGNEMSRLEFLADYVFNFTTYDSEMSELFARRALEVCAAISDESTFEYVEDTENYGWFLLMINMPFFARRLDWGTSIRGAWWVHEEQKLESCGIWRGDENVSSLSFTRVEWLRFIAALIKFSNTGGALAGLTLSKKEG